MKGIKLLLISMLISLSALSQTTPWTGIPAVSWQTRTLTGEKQIRALFGTSIISFIDSLHRLVTKSQFQLAKDSLVKIYTGNTIYGNNTAQGQWTFNGYTTFNNSAVYTQGAGGNGVTMQSATPMNFFNANNTSQYLIQNLAANATDTTAGLNIRNFTNGGNISVIGNNIKDSGGKYFLKSGSGIKDSTYNATHFVAKLSSGYGANITEAGGGSSKFTVDNSNGLTISGNTANVPGPVGFPTALRVVGMDARNYGIVNDNFGSSGGIFFGRRSQGTGAAPTAILQQQAMVDYSGAGYGSTLFGQASASFRMQAAQTFTDQNQGAMMTWYLSPLNTKGGEANGLKPVMQLTPDGALNITDLFEKIGGLVSPTNTGRRPSLTINNNTSKDSLIVASDLIITPTYVQKGTAGSSNILINRTETTLGSGLQKFASWQVSGAEKFSVDNTGLTKSTRVFANATAGTTAEDMGIVKNGTANLGMTNYNNATNLTNGSIIGQFAFNGYQNSAILGVARMTGYYMGDGTTRFGDLGLAVQNAGTYNELIRLSGSLMSVGIGTGATVGAKLHILSPTATQIRLGYSTGVYTDMTTASDGKLSIVPTGGATIVAGSLQATSIISSIHTSSNTYQTAAGTAGTDSLVVKNAGALRAIAANYYATVANPSFTGTANMQGIRLGYKAVTAATTFGAGDFEVNVTSGTFSQALPAAPNFGMVYAINNTGTGVVTVTSTSIGGLTSVVLSQGDWLMVQYTGVSGVYTTLSSSRTLVGGTGISVSQSNNTYTISATGNPVVEISGTSQSASGNTVYIPHNAALTTITIPTTTTIGTLYQVIGEGAGGWKLQLPTGAVAVGVGGFTTTSAGSLNSTDRYSTITVRYAATNKFVVTTSQGTITPL